MRKVDKVTIICWFCKKKFKVHPYRKETAKFCGFSCHGKYRIAQNPYRFFRDKSGKNHPNWGKHLTPEWRRKISKNHADTSGVNSGTWRGGITPINDSIRKSKEYIVWRIAIFTRDNYTCVKCHTKGGRLNADHIKPFALYPELRFAIDNGQTLCYVCHRKKTSLDMILLRKELHEKWN